MAEGNLGSLIVSISADLSELEKGLSKANQSVKTSAEQIADTTKKISTAMVAVGGAVVGAFGLMVKSAVDYGDQIYEVSQRTGIATETLSRLKYVADQTESSFEAVATGLRFLNRAMYQANQGGNETATLFKSLHISLRDASGQAKSAEDVFMQLADVFSKSSDQAAKTAIAMQVFGRSGVSLIPILNLGSKGIQELSAEADRLGLVLSNDNAVAIDKFSDGMKSLKAASGGLYLEISNAVLPTLTRFVEKAKETVAEIKKWMDLHPKLSQNIAETTLKVGALLVVLGSMGLLVIKVGEGLRALWLLLNTIVPLMTTFSLIKMGMLATEIGTVVAACGVFQTMIPIIGAGLVAWTIGTLIGQIKQVQDFFDWIVGADKAKAFEAQATAENQKAVAAKQALYPTADLGRIDINKPASEMDQKADPLSQIENQKAIQQEYSDWYQQMQNGLVAIDANANMEKIALAQQENQEKMSLVQTYNQEWQMAHRSMYALANTLVQTLQQGMTSAITGIVNGTMKAKDAFKQLGDQMVAAIVNFLVEQAVAWAISRAMAGIAHATASSMAATLAVAWAPAAFLASVATMGGAVAAGSAALTTGMVGAISMAGMSAATTSAGGAAGFAEGTDTVPAMLSPGEMIIPRSFSDAIRAGDLSLTGRGGSPSQVDNSKEVNVNITFSPIVNSQIDMEVATEQLGKIMEEQLRGVR